MATKEEAYSLMQEGYCVSHKLFSPNEFIWMDGNNCYAIKDEKGNDFETAWDLQDKDKEDKWQFGWYIYKGNTSGNPKLNVTQLAHQQGMKCPGQDRCLQYRYDEDSCTVCDVTDELRENETNKRPSILALIEKGDYEKSLNLATILIGHDPVVSGIETSIPIQNSIVTATLETRHVEASSKEDESISIESTDKKPSKLRKVLNKLFKK